MNNKPALLELLRQLNLDDDEAKIYLELLHGKLTHLRLSAITGINRTKVYRIVNSLEKRSLVARHTDDTGTFLFAADPTTLEVALVTQEEKLNQQRAIFAQVLPTLESIKSKDTSSFFVRTYEGVDGLKQMLWHELKTQGELLSFGGPTLEALILDHHWAERHRALSVAAGYRTRQILNSDIDVSTYTDNEKFIDNYECRHIPKNIVYFNEETIIYNDTVATYHWREDHRIGVEIISESYANMMRNVFEYYWKLSSKTKK